MPAPTGERCVERLDGAARHFRRFLYVLADGAQKRDNHQRLVFSDPSREFASGGDANGAAFAVVQMIDRGQDKIVKVPAVGFERL